MRKNLHELIELVRDHRKIRDKEGEVYTLESIGDWDHFDSSSQTYRPKLTVFYKSGKKNPTCELNSFLSLPFEVIEEESQSAPSRPSCTQFPTVTRANPEDELRNIQE